MRLNGEEEDLSNEPDKAGIGSGWARNDNYDD
jgi:hypothetical protein